MELTMRVRYDSPGRRSGQAEGGNIWETAYRIEMELFEDGISENCLTGAIEAVGEWSEQQLYRSGSPNKTTTTPARVDRRGRLRILPDRDVRTYQLPAPLHRKAVKGFRRGG